MHAPQVQKQSHSGMRELHVNGCVGTIPGQYDDQESRTQHALITPIHIYSLYSLQKERKDKLCLGVVALCVFPDYIPGHYY